MAPAGPSSIVEMNEEVRPYLFDIFVFDEYTDWLSVLGTVIIVSTTLALSLFIN